MFELVDTYAENAIIKVIGVGGGGGNAVMHMAKSNIDGVDFICANTDSQALKGTDVKTVLQLGNNITQGLGAGANPVVGREAALEDQERIRESISGADMLFITAGMGGGTGTGAAPVVAEIAEELGVLTVAVVTKPFAFEGDKRMKIANAGIEELVQHVDSLITIPNEKLMAVLGRETNLLEAFKSANDVLRGAVQGIAELITCPGLINVDFADVRTVMSEMGMAMMGSGTAAGAERAREAAEAAISSPLLEDVNIAGAKGILVNVTASAGLSIGEFDEIGSHIKGLASDDATVVVGTVIDESIKDSLRVTLVATGIGSKTTPAPAKPKMTLVETQAKKKPRPKDEGASTPKAPAVPVIEVVGKGQEYDLDYLDTPAIERVMGTDKKRRGASDDSDDPEDPKGPTGLGAVTLKSFVKKGKKPRKSLGDIDIPTFLRTQAD